MPGTASFPPPSSFRHLYISRRGGIGNGTGSLIPFAPISEKLDGVSGEPDWLWEGYLAPGAMTLLVGSPKIGKSTITFGLLHALANGQPFLGRITRPSGVLLLSEEGPGTLANKQARWNLPDNVHVITRTETFGHSWAETVYQAAEHCERERLSCLCVDTWPAWSRVEDENDTPATLAALEPLQLVAAELNLALLGVAHRNKSGIGGVDAVRGTSALAGGVDIVVLYERPRGLTDTTTRELKADSRFTSTPSSLIITLSEAGYAAHGDSITAKVETERESVLAYLQDTHEWMRSDEVATALELSGPKTRRHLDALHAAGRIDRQGTGVKGNPFLFRFRHEGTEYTAETNAETETLL